MGQTEIAVERAERALRLSPFDSLNYLAYNALAISHFVDGRYEQSHDAARRSIQLNPRSNRERTDLVPEARTASEQGFADLEFEAFLGFFGPRGMQKALQERISADIRAFSADAGLAARLSAAGLRMRTNTPAELSEIVERERRKVAEFARTADRTP